MQRNTINLGSPSVISQVLATPIASQMLDRARHIGLTLLRTFADRPSYVLGVTSAVPGEGKTSLSLALAEVMAADLGLKVVLLDGHPERSWAPLHHAFERQPGLGDWLSGTCQLEEALVSVHDRQAVLPFGRTAMTSRDLLQGLNRSDAIQQLVDRFSLIIVDMPELANPAGPALANFCDGVVLVVRANSTPADTVRDYLPVLQNVTLHGVVLNQHKSAVPRMLRRLFA